MEAFIGDEFCDIFLAKYFLRYVKIIYFLLYSFRNKYLIFLSIRNYDIFSDEEAQETVLSKNLNFNFLGPI